ncbi:hypothetical protein Kpol_507p12 [Vanderwaltozyma polyspora DSM 70294]|uniref:Transcriptional activator HAP2 n=1 Tax=Vanderwaltozyma polyspora (strain ATCC 22028 / DSM 70294 / BCRC 21397 / CBS 2163 / NBRC 10782 / NRRL Y-8283 / UCD 57-17) TaxID=436907 RepID=A7TPG4_VANPO|nr:uncharacterized protein Kpol_507p12 [Vanderwaltozyma polyspora DSM 70294]EDO15850.1 hypothetical protein Kpol_507p12 [Vanderwaltozyma polyspora DSM 70294]
MNGEQESDFHPLETLIRYSTDDLDIRGANNGLSKVNGEDIIERVIIEEQDPAELYLYDQPHSTSVKQYSNVLADHAKKYGNLKIEDNNYKIGESMDRKVASSTEDTDLLKDTTTDDQAFGELLQKQTQSLTAREESADISNTKLDLKEGSYFETSLDSGFGMTNSDNATATTSTTATTTTTTTTTTTATAVTESTTTSNNSNIVSSITNGNQGEESTEQPFYVNAKQYYRILKRRYARAKLEENLKISRERKPYLHESRHKHAMRRPRGQGGRFLTASEIAAMKEKEKANGTSTDTVESSST